MCLKSYFRCYLHYYFAFKTSIVKPQSSDVNTPEVKDALYGQMLKITFLNVKVAQVGLRDVLSIPSYVTSAWHSALFEQWGCHRLTFLLSKGTGSYKLLDFSLLTTTCCQQFRPLLSLKPSFVDSTAKCHVTVAGRKSLHPYGHTEVQGRTNHLYGHRKSKVQSGGSTQILLNPSNSSLWQWKPLLEEKNWHGWV